MARAFWRGTLSFGLVEIPVALRPAVSSDELSFTLLDRKDFSPVGYKRYNKKTGREVPWEQIVRGYEYEPDEYVVLTEEELKNAHPEQTQTIEILEFVEASEVDPVLFETPYYLEPQKRNSKGYILLHKALAETGRVGIARLVLRTRQRLAAVIPRGPVLALDLLRYAYEVLEPSQVAPVKAKGPGSISKAEIQMAERLIGDMTVPWDPEKYKDDYRDEVMALVEKKVKSGHTHEIVDKVQKRARTARGEVMDLMPLLKQSLSSHTKKSRTPRSRTRAKSETKRRRSAS
jgi:DNA end-binding protein Ku